MKKQSKTKAIWLPKVKDISSSQLTDFTAYIQTTHSNKLSSFKALHNWSTGNIENFWKAFLEFSEVKIGKQPRKTLSYLKGSSIFGSKWFEGATLNFTENLLEHKTSAEKPNNIAVCTIDELGNKKELSWSELKEQVSSLAEFYKSNGIKKGDRVSGICKNSGEALVSALAALSIGAIWSSAAPEFGVSAILQRFKTLGIKLLVYSPDYSYGGKYFDCRNKILEIKKELKPESLIELSSLTNTKSEKSSNVFLFKEIIKNSAPKKQVFEQFDFNIPAYILFSSGTTGSPKCITHGAGGTLIQHLKEHRLHLDFKPSDTVFYYSTLGWMMWNWLISALASGSKIVLYDGSPVHQNTAKLLQLSLDENVSVFGTSARYLMLCQKNKISLKKYLKDIRLVLSTGSPLLPEQFDYFYKAGGENTLLGSISGGTDIVSCFALAQTTEPLYRGEIQTAGLGMSLAALSNEAKELFCSPGELVCKKPFPSQPLYFWNDEDNRRYKASYFERFAGFWHHGDWAEMLENGGVVIYGRSDATLNPGGVRIGTSEIYNIVETFDEISESLACGQNFKGAERIILFLQMKKEDTLDSVLKDKIKLKIKKEASPRHVPSIILEIPDIPKTQSGKAVEMIVKSILNKQELQSTAGLENPESLKVFYSFLDKELKI